MNGKEAKAYLAGHQRAKETEEWVSANAIRDPIVGLIGTLAHARKYTDAEEPFVKDLLDRLDSITNELASLLPENQ